MVTQDNIIGKSDLKEIFYLHYDSLVVYAKRFIFSLDACEDLVQDVFVELWEKDIKFPDVVSLKAYLYKVVRNKCYNIIKHDKIKNKHAENVKQAIEDDNFFLKQIIEEEVVNYLYKAIDKLPERKKEIIKLSLKGLKNYEIAEELGIKLQTVKTLKSQSYKVLREQFTELSAFIYFLLMD
ncbi:RNA polymerase sigma-70 factor [Pseudotamlana agarivorans]|uniref:RNA polymerase sigma-70 factor n=1 Tax=Pseudotamlana agarivorans TaxID=481183 RepID=UPI000830EFB9|nr:RNA polymerase sigma-70 factor [Tamlana agarivorans]